MKRYIITIMMLLFSFSPAYAAELRIVTTIPPVYSITKAVVGEAGEVQLLLEQNQSPHHLTLKPSQLAKVKTADKVLYIHEEFEAFLTSLLKEIPKEKQLQLADAPGITLLARQKDTVLPSDHDEGEQGEHEDHDHEHGHEHHGTKDYHLWLDPDDAVLMAEYIAVTLGKDYPEHAHIFTQNAKHFRQEIIALDKEWQTMVAPLKETPLLVFHDGYQYWQRHYGLKHVYTVTLHPDVPLSAKRLQALQMLIAEKKIACLFTEPQYPADWVKGLAHQGITVETLDPEGTSLPDKSYKALLTQLAEKVAGCVKH